MRPRMISTVVSGFSRTEAWPRLCQIERGRVPWLIQAELATAGQPDRRPDAPVLFFDLGARDLFRGECFDRRFDVVAHQVDDGGEHLVAGVLLPSLAVERMERGF